MTHILRIPSGLREQLARYGIFPSDLVVYINSTCNLRCRHCYVGDQLLDQSMRYKHDDIIGFVQDFDKIERLTIVGGEPLLHPEINSILSDLPYKQIGLTRITTNLTNLSVFKTHCFIDAPILLAVSLDGHAAELHDPIRGAGAFSLTVSNLKTILSLGYNVEITHTINQKNISHFGSFLDFCQELGVKQVNLHKVSLQGNALANRQLAVSPSQWVQFRQQLERSATTSIRRKRNIAVRLPILFVSKEEFDRLFSAGKYHHHADGSFYAEQGHRIVLYPDGRLYVSSEAFGTESYIGDILTGQFRYNDRPDNELNLFRKGSTSITSVNSEQHGDEGYPAVLSVSYKILLIL